MEYLKDCRKPIKEIYSSFEKLEKAGWIKEIIYIKKFNSISFSAPVFRTKKTGKAVWLLAGIHGEEPAGVNAISENINFLIELGKKHPLVVLPLCNPKGYFLNWRYPDQEKYEEHTSPSVGSSEHFLPDLKNPSKARSKKPVSREALKLTSYVIKMSESYPPLLSLDLHEDNDMKKCYIYSQGKLKDKDPIAKEIVKILMKNLGVELKGKTDSDEKISQGIVSKTNDSSIDELLASDKIIIKNKIIKKQAAKTAIVIETPSLQVSIKKRIKAHSALIKAIPKLLTLAS